MLAGDVFHHFHGLPRTVTFGSLAGDHGRGEHVEAFDRSRPGGIAGGAERRQGDHRAVAAAHEKQVDVVAVGAVGRFGLDVNLVDAVEHVEVIDVHRAGEGFQGRENVGHRHAEDLGLVAVHVEVQLGNLRLHRRGYARDFLAA